MPSIATQVKVPDFQAPVSMSIRLLLYIGMWHRRVAVNDEFAVVPAGRIEKFVTDPEQIVRILTLERNAGAYAGVHEQKISAAIDVSQSPQEQFVESREDGEKASAQVRRRFVASRMNAVGGEGL